MSNAAATDVSSAGATLHGSWSGATGEFHSMGFKYGISTSSLTYDLPATLTQGAAGELSATLSGLKANTTYYYKAYVQEYNESTGQQEYRYASTASSFKTKAVATASVTTGNATNLSSAGATLQGSWSGATGTVYESGFLFGTSSNNLSEDDELKCDGSNNASGSFSIKVGSLNQSTTYYFKAYIREYNESTGNYDYRYGSVMSFKTTAPSSVSDRGYLDCYEIPDVSVLTYNSNDETHGDTKYHAYTTSNSSQVVVSHTFAYNGTKRNYSLLYDKDKKAALWVAFAMNTGSYPWLIARSDSWKYDPAIPEDWQPNLTNAYQNGSTYSRGHQCASNDRRTTTEQTRQTNYFTNMTPQLSGFNGGVWATLEGDIQKIGNATSGSDTLYVVTGPIFESGYSSTPDKFGVQCAIPAYYYKCIMKVSFSGHTPVSAIGAAYLMEHKNSGSVRQEVTIDSIEQMTGFDFFAHIPTSIQNAAEAEKHPTSYFPQKSTSTSE